MFDYTGYEASQTNNPGLKADVRTRRRDRHNSSNSAGSASGSQTATKQGSANIQMQGMGLQMQKLNMSQKTKGRSRKSKQKQKSCRRIRNNKPETTIRNRAAKTTRTASWIQNLRGKIKTSELTENNKTIQESSLWNNKFQKTDTGGKK